MKPMAENRLSCETAEIDDMSMDFESAITFLAAPKPLKPCISPIKVVTECNMTESEKRDKPDAVDVEPDSEPAENISDKESSAEDEPREPVRLVQLQRQYDSEEEETRPCPMSLSDVQRHLDSGYQSVVSIVH